MEVNAKVLLPGDPLCDNSYCENEIGNVCDVQTGGEVLESNGNGSEGKGEVKESACQNDVSEHESIDGYQHNKPNKSVVMTRESPAKPLTNNVMPGLQTLSPKSILIKHGMSASPRSKKLVRFALIALDKRGSKETNLSSSHQNDINVNALLTEKFDQVSMSQTNVVVSPEKVGNARNFSDQPVKSMSASNLNLCDLDEDKVSESESVCSSISDKLKSLVNIVRGNCDNSIDSSSSDGFPEANDNANKDTNYQNTSGSLSPLESKSSSNVGRKFASPSKTYLHSPVPSSPKSSIFVRRGFPRIVLRDKSNKPQRFKKKLVKELQKGKECHSKYTETSHNFDPKHLNSANVNRRTLFSSEKLFTELNEDCETAALPSVQNNKLTKILEVSLEKIDENILMKYGLNIEDHNLTKLSKCHEEEDRCSVQNVNDDLKENTDIEIQKAKRGRSTQIIEKTLGKNVEVNKKVLDAAEGLGESSSSLKNLPTQKHTTECIENKDDRPNEELQKTDTSISLPVINEENNNVTNAPCLRPLSDSIMSKDITMKYVRIHITPLDPVLLSKYGIHLEHGKPSDRNNRLRGPNENSKLNYGGFSNRDTKMSINNEYTTPNDPPDKVRGSRKSFLSNDLVAEEAVTLDQSDRDILETGIQEGRRHDNSNFNLKKSRKNIDAISNDTIVVKAFGNNKTSSEITGSYGDIEAVSRNIPHRNVKSSNDALVDGHEPTRISRIKPIHVFEGRVNLENQKPVDNNAELASHNIENKVSDGEINGCNSKTSVSNEDSINNDAANNVRRSKSRFVSNDPVAKVVVTTNKSDRDTLEAVTRKRRCSNISDSNLKKSKRYIGANSNDLKIFNAVVSIKALQLRGYCTENNVINGEFAGCDTKISINNEDSTPNDPQDVRRSRSNTVSNDPVTKVVVTTNKSDGGTLETYIQEGRNSVPNLMKSKRSIGGNLNDREILNTVVSNNTSHSGNVECAAIEISQEKGGHTSDGIIFDHKSTPKPDSSQKINHSEVQKSLSKGDTILLNNSIHSFQVAVVRLSRIDCDLPRYGIDKGQLLGSSCEKVSLAKETNYHNDQGTTKPNVYETDGISTSEISPLDSPFKSKKRKRDSSNTSDVALTSSERHSKRMKISKTK